MPKPTEDFQQYVIGLIEQGANPNELLEQFEDAVNSTELWGLWGDGTWRSNTVCSKCGSHYAGICADAGSKAGVFDFDNPAYHKNQAGVGAIPYLEWKKQAAKEAQG